MICPGCYAVSDGDECADCRESVRLDGKLALLEPLGRDHPNVFRGLLGEEPVVVKVLDVGALRDWRDHDRFRAQSEILEALRGLPVPCPLGDFQRRGRVFHCQTLLPGSPLGTSRPPVELEALARRLLQVLAEIHARGIVHRDLKPEHVVVDDGRVQLIDFGSARHFAAGGGVEPTVVGTPGYMAPEQVAGETRYESDLYAAGKVLQAALAGRRHRRLERLIRRLTHPDWSKRRQARSPAQLAWLAVPFVVAGALVGAHQLPQPEPSLPLPARLPSSPSLGERARALLDDWQAAQNGGDFQHYASLYGEKFSGVRRSARGPAHTLDRAAWLAERQKMFKPTLHVETDGVLVTTDEGRATLDFQQHFRNGGYSDHGHKRMIIEDDHIVSEEMLDSRPGWDEAEYRRRFPAHGATCEAAFDPSAHEYLVALARYDDYTEALRAAGKQRRRGNDVEIVLGEDFQALDAGYWLLSGAADDRAEADELAARTHGRVVRAATRAPRFPSVLRFLEERPVDSSPELITAAGDMLYVVNTGIAFAFKLVEDRLEEQYRVLMPAARPVRVAVREGHAFILDEEGHWSLLSENGITPTRSFDPQSEGRVAVFGMHRFEIEGDELAYRLREQEAHRVPLRGRAGVWRLGADRLVLYREGLGLFLFAVGETPLRLTKVCGAVSGEMQGPAHLTVGAIDLDTDGEGGFEIWSSEWGFFAPSVSADPVCPKDCYHEETAFALEAQLFRRPKLELTGSTSCDCYEDGC